MQKTIKLAYNVLIIANGVLLLLGVYETEPFLGILAALYGVNKIVAPIVK